MITRRDIGQRVHTHVGVDGIAVGIRRNGDGNEVVDVELDGHTYGPGRPADSFPIGTVWRDAPAEPAGPSWFPVTDTSAAERRRERRRRERRESS